MESPGDTPFIFLKRWKISAGSAAADEGSDGRPLYECSDSDVEHAAVDFFVICIAEFSAPASKPLVSLSVGEAEMCCLDGRRILLGALPLTGASPSAVAVVTADW